MSRLSRAERSISHVRTLAVSAAALWVALAAPANATEPAGNPFAPYRLVTDTRLDDLRGGFFRNDLLLNFAIDMVTRINGRRVLQASLRPTGLEFAGPRAAAVNITPSQITTLVQTGPGNHAPTAFSDATGVFNVIQNTLNNAVIQQLTNIRLDLAAAALANNRAALAASMNAARGLTLR